MANELSTSTTATTGPSNVIASAQTPPCPGGASPVAGGFRAPYAQGAARETIFVTESTGVGGSWLVSGDAFGDTGLTLSLTALAYCR